MKCEDCKYSHIDDRSDGHCYMFKEKPSGRCAQFRSHIVELKRWGFSPKKRITGTSDDTLPQP